MLSRVRGLTAPRDAGSPDPDTGAKLLLECVKCLKASDQKGLSAYLSALRDYADDGISAEQRQRYRTIVDDSRLLWPKLPPVPVAGRFYDTLLRVMYGLPLSYQAYCDVEDLLAAALEPDQAFQHPLLEAINDGGTADIRVTAITLHQLGTERLTGWFRSGQVDVRRLISALAGKWDRPRHADILYEVTLQLIRDMPGGYDQRAIVEALRSNGYLAAAVRQRYPQSNRDQILVLCEFLQAAYPARLDRGTVSDVFAASAPTAAMAVAVLRQLADPTDLPWAVGVFAARLDGTDADPARKAGLLRLLSGLND